MAKEHKKLYKAGKNWLVAALFAVAAGTALATASVHADTTTDQGQNTMAVQQNATTTTGNDQETGSTAATNNQPVPVTPQATAQNDDSEGQEDNFRVDDPNNGVSDELLAKINAAQKAVDQQQAVVNQDTTTAQNLDREIAKATQEAKDASAQYDIESAQYDIEKEEYNKKVEQYNNPKRINGYETPEYQALEKKAKEICPGWGTNDPYKSAQATLDLAIDNPQLYQEFMRLQTQMTQILNAADEANKKVDELDNELDQLNNEFDQLNKKQDISLQAWEKVNKLYDKKLVLGDKLPKENSELATLIDQLSTLKSQQLTIMLRYSKWLAKQSFLLTITYVDQAGNIIGTKQYAGKYNQDVTKEVKLTPAGYHYADDPQRAFKLTDHNDKVTVLVAKDQQQPVTVHEQVNYVATDGQTVGTQTLTGQPGQQFIAGNLTIPTGYKLEQSGSILITLGDSDGQFTVQVVREQLNRPVDLSQNNGWLDSYSAQNGKLHLAGWHVSSASADYQYPYIIVLDNGREVGRAQAQLVDRSDVDRLYPNTNGRQAAGFFADVDIPTYAYGDRLTVIARFSNDPAGNGQYQDYYFNNLNPVTDLNANKANLDGYHLSTNSRNGDIQLNVAGWHAAGRSVTEGSHWLILFDNTTGSEIQRVKLSDADNYVVSRPDVARAFPGIANSGQSGFDGTFDLSRTVLGHNLSVIARYSDDAINGEGNRTDYWLAVPRLVNSQVNAGWVDNYHAERGTDGTGIDLVVSGWHVAGNSLAQPYHWVILYDNDTHREVVRMPVKDQASDFYGNPHFATQPILRPDVARQYQNVLDSNRSGFEARFALLPSTSQHSLSIISRYSDDAVNGEGNRTDYWMPAMRLDQGNHANLDNISLSGNQLHVSGWHATNQLGADEHVVILYDATQHRELSRQIVGRLARPDVAKAFPTIYNAADSGFSAAFDFQPEMAHDQIQIVSRWTSAGSENSDYVDYWFAPQLLVSDQSNRANLDDFSLANGQLTATGWHASNQALGKQYHYVILFDQTTGQELSRVETLLVQRPDVARAFPTILNAGESGFNVNFAFDPAQLDGHRLAIVSRWTTDPAGNGNATDYWFAPQTFTAAQPASRAVRGTGDGVGALDKWAVFINPALSSDNPNRIFFFASGWHASNATTGRPYHDIMLIDNTTGQQVGGATYGNPMLPARDTSRPDIARLYGNQYQNAGESGFKIGLQTPRFTFGHRYTLVSRYANDENGSNAVQQSYYLGQINQDMVNYGDGHDFFN
ncbi:KxYKxGKxW signal peptide domain-containing protein [Limosilactobacillus oris]|uniref:KxYKxGKxW signal peptide domain-containing protein n=1 Tax=Limosilactobacillus oris TaxID=1632 RepID=UPI001749BDEB|nr:KxYKxGKxW signal peptide domain-containing protein [Limosilactobacillus oris]